MANIVYVLCALTSIVCALLLLRSWLRQRTRLLLWCSACFVGLALNNILLLVDLWVVPNVDLTIVRSVCALIAIGLFLYGLIWEA